MDYLDPVAASDDGFDFSFLSSTASSASSYSPHSTGTSAGLPTEEDIFSLMGGACSDIDGANTVFDGLESWLEGKLDMDGVDGGNASFGRCVAGASALPSGSLPSSLHISRLRLTTNGNYQQPRTERLPLNGPFL